MLVELLFHQKVGTTLCESSILAGNGIRVKTRSMAANSLFLFFLLLRAGGGGDIVETNYWLFYNLKAGSVFIF